MEKVNANIITAKIQSNAKIVLVPVDSQRECNIVNLWTVNVLLPAKYHFEFDFSLWKNWWWLSLNFV